MIKHPNFIYVSAPDDFESVSGTLIFSSDVTESCFTVMIVDDSIRESVRECFTVTIVDATGDIELPSVATACIEDNDGNLEIMLMKQKGLKDYLLKHVYILPAYNKSYDS